MELKDPQQFKRDIIEIALGMIDRYVVEQGGGDDPQDTLDTAELVADQIIELARASRDPQDMRDAADRWPQRLPGDASAAALAARLVRLVADIMDATT